MVGSAAIKQGRSANRKDTLFFFWPEMIKFEQAHGVFLVISRRPRVTVTPCFVYKGIRDL